MYYLYVLESESSGMLYIGQSQDIEKRFLDHNRGASKYTKGKGPWKLIYRENFEFRSGALALEKKLKSWKNPERIKSMILRNANS